MYNVARLQLGLNIVHDLLRKAEEKSLIKMSLFSELWEA